MTNEEALEYWEGIRCGFYDDARKHPTFMERSGKTFKLNMILAIIKAIEALEKQIPMRVEEKQVVEDEAFYNLDFLCPACKNAVIGQPYKPSHCKHCGQALKWEE